MRALAVAVSFLDLPPAEIAMEILSVEEAKVLPAGDARTLTFS